MKDGVFYSAEHGRLLEKRGCAIRIYWSPQMLDDLRKHYADTENKELAQMFCVSLRTVARKARELGLKKSDAFMGNVRRSNFELAHIAQKKSGHREMFVEKYSFKKGHRFYGKSEQRRIEGIVRTLGKKMLAEGARKKYEWLNDNPNATAKEAYEAGYIDGFAKIV